MNSRSKRYYENRKADKGDKKGSSSEAGYNEQNEKNIKEPKENPAVPKNQDQPAETSLAEQDDTIGVNHTAEKTDES